MVDNIVWEKVKGHSHVLMPIEWGFEVHILNVGSGELGIRGADDTVPHDLRRQHVGGACGQFKGVLDKIPTHLGCIFLQVKQEIPILPITISKKIQVHLTFGNRNS